MKFNPLEWSEVKQNAQVQIPSGLLQLRSSAPFALAIESEGVEVPYGEAHEFRLVLKNDARITVKGKAPVVKKDRPRRDFKSEGEVFTNLDRMPYESGSVDAVTRAARMFKLEQRAMMRELREERALIEAARKPAEAPASEPAKAAEPELPPGEAK